MLPIIPSDAPTHNGSVSGWIGRMLLKLSGWTVEGEFPNEKKLVIALAPHTSNWDFIFAMYGLLALQLKISFLMKKEAFIWPLAPLFCRLGGIPLDRKKGHGTVDNAVLWFSRTEKGWLAIAPEGTRSKTDRWKTGFIEIARQANIPVVPVCWDYPRKTIFINPIWALTGDSVKDAEEMRAFIRSTYTGKHPNLQ